MARSPVKKELLSAEDVAALMGVKESTVWRWCREGRLPCLKVGKHWRVRRVQSSHSANILASESGLSLSRATPMPPT